MICVHSHAKDALGISLIATSVILKELILPSLAPLLKLEAKTSLEPPVGPLVLMVTSSIDPSKVALNADFVLLHAQIVKMLLIGAPLAMVRETSTMFTDTVAMRSAQIILLQT